MHWKGVGWVFYALKRCGVEAICIARGEGGLCIASGVVCTAKGEGGWRQCSERGGDVHWYCMLAWLLVSCIGCGCMAGRVLCGSLSQVVHCA